MYNRGGCSMHRILGVRIDGLTGQDRRSEYYSFIIVQIREILFQLQLSDIVDISSKLGALD